MANQIFKQIEGDNRYINEIRIYRSIIDKFSSSQDVIKLTKEETKRLETQVGENVKHLKNKIKKAWFFKKWLYKPLLAQYEGILNNHFNKR